MSSENLRGLYLRVPDSCAIPPKQEIIKGLSSNDLSTKERFFNFLILSIMQDPNNDQMIMSVINNIVSVQHKSCKLRKLTFVYWELITKRKLDGTLIDEFILVCNCLRKDLNHPNEFIISSTLKLIGRIAIPEIIDPLISSILDQGLKHHESIIRKNTIECFYNLYLKLGQDMLPDISKEVIEFIGKEEDVTTKRNALSLLAKLSAEDFVKLVMDILKKEGVEGFYELEQIIVVRELFEICKDHSRSKVKYLKIIFHFFQSPFVSVLNEIDSQVAKFTNNFNLLSSSIGNLLKILAEISDVNVKLLICAKIDHYQKLNPKLVENILKDLLSVFESSEMEVKISLLRLINKSLELSVVQQYSTMILKELSLSLDAITMDDLTAKYVSKLISSVKSILSHLTHTNEESYLEQLSPMLRKIISLKKINDKISFSSYNVLSYYLNEVDSAKEKKVAFLASNILNIQNERILLLAAEYLNNNILEEQGISVLREFTNWRDSLVFLSSNQKAEESNLITNQDKVTGKTVIQEDGTYGTEYVKIKESVKNNNNTNLSFTCINTLISGDYISCISLFRLFYKILGLLFKNRNKDLGIYKKEILIPLLSLYKYFVKKEIQDSSFYKEMNTLISNISKDSYQQFEMSKSSKEINLACKDGSSTADSAVNFGELINFRQLK